MNQPATRTIRWIDLATGSVTRYKAGSIWGSVAIGYGAVWVTRFTLREIARIDLAGTANIAPTQTPSEPPASDVDAVIQVGGAPFCPAFGAGSVWVGDSRFGKVLRIDPATNTVIAEIPTGSTERKDITFDNLSGIGSPSLFVVARDDMVWATRIVTAFTPEYALIRIDPATNEVVQVVPLTVRPWAMALDGDTLWVTSREDGVVVRVDVLSGDVEFIRVYVPEMIAVGHGAVWVTSGTGGDFGWVPDPGAFLTRINPATSMVAAVIPIDGGTVGVAVDDAFVWVSNGGTDLSGGSAVYKVDPATNQIIGAIEAEGVQYMLTHAGSIWAVRASQGTIQIDAATGETLASYPERSFWGSVAIGYGAVWVTRFTKGQVARIELE